MKEMSQESGDGATNIQAGRDVVYKGLSPSEATEIAYTLFERNFPDLVRRAETTARERVEELVRQLIEKMTSSQTSLDAFSDPDVQYSLMEAERDYARSGSEHLRNLLVDLLVARCSTGQSELQPIVLSESISAARKLSHGQIASLTLCWYFRYTTNGTVGNHDALAAAISKLEPLVRDSVTDSIQFSHMQYSAVGKTEVLTRSLESAISSIYPGLFQPGYSDGEIPETIAIPPYTPPLFTPCLNDRTKTQVNALNADVARRLAQENGVDPDEYANLLTYKLDESKIGEIIDNLNPVAAELRNKWNNSNMNCFTLSSVGIAIAHTNWAHVTGDTSPLSIWVP